MSGNWSAPVPRWRDAAVLQYEVQRQVELHRQGKSYFACIKAIERTCEWLERTCP